MIYCFSISIVKIVKLSFEVIFYSNIIKIFAVQIGLHHLNITICLLSFMTTLLYNRFIEVVVKRRIIIKKKRVQCNNNFNRTNPNLFEQITYTSKQTANSFEQIYVPTKNLSGWIIFLFDRILTRSSEHILIRPNK